MPSLAINWGWPNGHRETGEHLVPSIPAKPVTHQGRYALSERNSFAEKAPVSNACSVYDRFAAHARCGNGAKGRFGDVHFPISCKAEVQANFDSGVALLHSFEFREAEAVFRNVEDHDLNA
jgi:hypothetical protein